MEKQMMFHILKIQETKDQNAIKAAYRELLKENNPEDHPEGFRRLREAYEGALKYAMEPECREEEKEKTEMDLWLERADRAYQDISSRFETEEWEELLSDPLCEDLDTSLDAREQLLKYLMDHVNLSQKVWLMIDKTFQIREDRETLEQKFPGDFLDYIIFYMEHQEFIDYRLFLVTDKKNQDLDAYLRGYFPIKRAADQKETEGLEEMIRDLNAFGLYHPFQDVELIKGLLAMGEKERALSVCGKLLDQGCENAYVLLACAEALWENGRREEAGKLWEQILAGMPDHYAAIAGKARYLMYRENYPEAKALLLDLISINPDNGEVAGLLEEANGVLIERYKKALEEPYGDEEKRKEDMVELGWCLFQNQREKEAIALLENMDPGEKEEYSYTNLFGRILYKDGRYEEAAVYLKKWLDLILKTEDDGSEENKKRISREFQARYYLSGCYRSLDDFGKALEYADGAIKAAKETGDWFSSSQYRAQILYDMGEYEKCMDGCDRILEEDGQYYPACVLRLEAAFELRKGQQVVDDYYRAISIYNGYYKPYFLAARVFFIYNQFDDAKGVMDRARENQVDFSPAMKLLEARILRNLAKSPEERKPVFGILEELKKMKEGEETDIEDPSELDFELSLLYWDNREMGKAEAHIKSAIEQNPERGQYHAVCGNMHMDMEQYKMALKEYTLAEEDYSESAGFYYNWGLCYEKTGLYVLARECFDKTLKLQKGYGDAAEKLADYYKDQYTKYNRRADYEKALEYLNHQLEAEDTCYYRVERGLLYMRAFELQEAMADFEKALEYEPEDWAAWNNLGCCYKYLCLPKKAIEAFERAVKCMKEGRESVLPYSNMADCYALLGDNREAIRCYERDLERFPEWTSFYEEIASLYTDLGEYDLALENLEKAPKDEDYYGDMARILVGQGKRKEAIKILEQGVKKARDEEDRIRRIMRLGNHYLMEELDTKKAVAVFKKALARDKTGIRWFETESRLAAQLFRLGERERARYYAERALNHLSVHDGIRVEDYINYKEYRSARLLRIGWCYIALGDERQGLKMFEEMRECVRCRSCVKKECYESYLCCAWYYDAVNQEEKALECYEMVLKCGGPHTEDARWAEERIRVLKKKLKRR